MDPRDLRESVDRAFCKSHFHTKKCIFETVRTTLLTFLIHLQKLTLMVIVPVLEGFPMYRLTASQKRKTNQKSLLFISQDVDTDLSGNVRKQMDGWV